MTEVQMAALDYAAKLEAYYDLKVHCDKSKELHGEVLREDSSALRRNYDEMCDAQNQLAMMCHAKAEKEYA